MINEHRLLQALYRESLSAFTQKTFGIVSGGDNYLHNWHVDYISQHLEACLRGDIKRLIINIPPRYMKSICASVAFPAWVLGKDPYKKIIVASYAQELSLKHSIDCKSLMENSFYKDVFPGLSLSRKRNTQMEYMTTRGGFRMSTSVGGTLTGRGGDILIIDDPIKPRDAYSNTARASVNQWYDSTLYSRLNGKEDGCIIIIMQRLHEDDLVGHVLEQEDWVHIKIPAIAEEEERILIRPNCITPYEVHRNVRDVLHPERESLLQLEHLKNNVMGSYNFAGQYQQEPSPLGGGMIKFEWFQRYDDLPTEKPKRIVQSWDTASKTGELNDYSVGTTWCEYESCWYLVDVFRERVEYPDLKKKVISHAKKYSATAILIEDKSSGTQLIQEIKREHRLPMKGINPESDKISRMIAQTPQIEAGNVFIPRNATWLSEFENEMMKFPQSRHDDQIDSVSQALKWMAKPKVTFKVGKC